MSGRTWLIADPHFSHAGVCKFLRDDGTKLRPWDDLDEMDKELIKNWNSVVEDKDRVYVLGDVCMRKQQLSILNELKGRLVLIKGNHDIFEAKEYLKYFDDIRAYVVQKTQDGRKVILSHIPIHPDSVGLTGINICGHLHAGIVKLDNGKEDKRYVCVSVEQINYTPILLQEAIKRAGEQAT